MQALHFLTNVLLSLFSTLFLLRFYMQCCRVSFVGDLGRFIAATTNWAVTPLRRLFPPWRGIDWSCFLLVWLANTIFVHIWLPSGLIATNRERLLPESLLQGFISTAHYLIQLLIILIIVSVIMSWLRLYSPAYMALRETLSRLTQPLLAPIRRFIPPIANIDLSPLVAIVLLQALSLLL